MNFNHKKSLGQNFLKDNNIINKIADSIVPEKNDLIIEIGPGAGALTKKLVTKNCDVICFEIDKRLEPILGAINSENLKIVFEDFLKVNLKDYIDSTKYNHIHFVGNLPYYITTAIINKIINESDPYEITIMVQKEVGNRFIAKPNSKDYNSLSVFLQYNFEITKVTDVSKHCFDPVPKVESVVIKLKSNKKIIAENEEHFYKLVKDSFKQKRKTLKNNLTDYNFNEISKYLIKNNKTINTRAEEISLEEFVTLSNYLSKNNQ